MIWSNWSLHIPWLFKAFSSGFRSLSARFGSVIPSWNWWNCPDRFNPGFSGNRSGPGVATIFKGVSRILGQQIPLINDGRQNCHRYFDDFPIKTWQLTPTTPLSPPYFWDFHGNCGVKSFGAGAVLALRLQRVQPKSLVVRFFLIVIGASGRIPGR